MLQEGGIIQGRPKGGIIRVRQLFEGRLLRSAIIQGNIVAGDCQEGPSTCHSYLAADVLDKYQK